MTERKRIRCSELPRRWESLKVGGYPQIMICGMEMWRAVGEPGTEVEVIEDEEIKILLFAIHDHLKWLKDNP